LPKVIVMANLLRYAIVLEPEPDAGGFSVHIPAFPEAHTQGETIEECLTNAREVIELCLDVRRDEGEEAPPSDVGAMLVMVDVPAA